MKHNRLSQLLVRRGLVAPPQLDRAVHVASASGGTHGWVEQLILSAVLDERELCWCVSGSEHVQLCDTERLAQIPPHSLAVVPHDIAAEHRAVPLGVDTEGYLHLAMMDPSDDEAIQEIGFFAGRPLVREVATATMIAWALHTYYGAHTVLWPRAPQETPVLAAPMPKAITASQAR